MSDEQRTREEPEIEGQVERDLDEEPAAEDEDGSDVEAHMRRASIRMD